MSENARQWLSLNNFYRGKPLKDFEKKVAVITGGANGLGRAFAEKAATLKMKLVLGDIRQEPLQQAVAALNDEVLR